MRIILQSNRTWRRGQRRWLASRFHTQRESSPSHRPGAHQYGVFRQSSHHRAPVFFLYLTGELPPSGHRRPPSRSRRGAPPLAQSFLYAMPASRAERPRTPKYRVEANPTKSAPPLLRPLLRRRRGARRVPERRKEVGLTLLDLCQVLSLTWRSPDLLGRAAIWTARAWLPASSAAMTDAIVAS